MMVQPVHAQARLSRIGKENFNPLLSKVVEENEGTVSDDRGVVITRVDGRRVGLVVDEVIGQHQTVVKPLSLYHRGIEGLAGSTILGDGSVALILDPAARAQRVAA